MNKVYKSVWNESIGAWVAVSETAKGRGKKSNKKIVSSVLLTSASAAGGLAFAPASFASQVCTTRANGTSTSSIQGGGTSLLAECGSNAYLPSGHDIAELEAGASVMYVDGTAGTVNFRATSAGNMVTINSAGQIRNIGAGTSNTDAVNVGQLKPVVNALGGKAVLNAGGSVTSPTYSLKGSTYNNVGDALTALADSSGKYFHANSGLVDSSATGVDSVAIGGGASASGFGNTAIGRNAKSIGPNNSIAIGDTVVSTSDDAVSMGSQITNDAKTGVDSVAIGGAAVASAKNAVALGSSSVADRDNSVSVGTAGKERQITNVAAGTAPTDAVNVGQLTTVSNNLDTLNSFAVKYDSNTDGTPNHEKVTLGGAAATKPTLLTNLASGKLTDDSTDAVNGSQLYATNQNVAALQDFTNNVNNGGDIKYFHSNSTLADSSATGTDSVAIGGAALSSGKNSVALGSNSVADRDNTVSVGAAGSERQVTNVAAGTAATDAANVGQLNAESNSVSSLGASAIKYDNNADGTPDYANATLGNGNTGTALHNVAAGTSAMDAVNLSQLNDMMGQVTNLANGAYNPLFTADGNRDTEVATSSGTHSVASGANAVASGVNAVASGPTSVASGANAVAFGSNTSATANNAVAVGAKASATANNAVALGAGSVADRANSVSVGTTAAGGQRQITNVAAGTDGTDAVNVNQMQQSVNTGVKSAKGYTDALRSDMNSGLSLANNHINSVGAMSSAMAMMAGSAAAIADKDNRFEADTGVYRDKAAIAIGFQKRFGTNMVLTVGGSTTGEETTGGAGFAFGF
jgi:autotransporter adhesin